MIVVLLVAYLLLWVFAGDYMRGDVGLVGDDDQYASENEEISA